MVRVPILPGRDVEPEGYSGRQVIDAPLDAFGAAQARALADAGEAVDEVADLAETIFRKEQAKSMEIERLEAEAKTRAAADKVLNGALSRTGKDALGVTTEVDQALEKMERDTIANADPANHDKLTAHVGGLRRQAGGTTAAHEARQKDGYRDVLLADSIDRHREGAISAYDPERNPDPAARAVGPIRRRLVMLTPDAEPADIERRLAAEMSGIHERVVSGLVEDGRGAEALAYLGRAMETNAIAAERVDDLRALTAITVVDEAVLDKTNEILARHKGDHDSQLAAARTIESPELRLGVERYLGHAKAGDTRAERERVDRRLMAAAAKAGQQGATLTATDKAVMTPTARTLWHQLHREALTGLTPAFNAAADDELTEMIMRAPEKFAAMSLPAYFAEHAMTEGQRNAFIAAQDMLRNADPAELAQLRRKTASYLSGYAAMRQAADSAGIDWLAPPGSEDAKRVLGLKTAVRDFVDHHAATHNDRVPTGPQHEEFAASHMMGVTADVGAAPGSSPAGGSDNIPTGGVETQYLLRTAVRKWST